MGGVLDDVNEVLDRLAAAELSDSESVIELHRTLARLDAIHTEAVGRWDAGREWSADGAKSAAAWLAWGCRVPQQSARRRVRLARTLRELPVAAEAWRAGEIESSHVAVLGAARSERTAEVLARDEAVLVDEARRLRFSHFQRVVAYWCQHADPDGAEADAQRLVDDRRLDVSSTFRVRWWVTSCSTRSAGRSSPTSCSGSRTPSSGPTGRRRRNAWGVTRW